MSDPLIEEAFTGADEAVIMTVVRSGQPRAYADTERVCRYTRVRSTPNVGWVYSGGDILMQHVEKLHAGYLTNQTRNVSDPNSYFQSYVDYIRFTDDTARTVEVRVVTPYCD